MMKIKYEIQIGKITSFNDKGISSETPLKTLEISEETFKVISDLADVKILPDLTKEYKINDINFKIQEKIVNEFAEQGVKLKIVYLGGTNVNISLGQVYDLTYNLNKQFENNYSLIDNTARRVIISKDFFTEVYMKEDEEKVVCIETEGLRDKLSIGKVYHFLGEKQKGFFTIKGDHGEEEGFSKSRFVKIKY